MKDASEHLTVVCRKVSQREWSSNMYSAPITSALSISWLARTQEVMCYLWMDAAAMVLVLLLEALPSCGAHADVRYQLHALRWPAALVGKVSPAAVAFVRSCGGDTVWMNRCRSCRSHICSRVVGVVRRRVVCEGRYGASATARVYLRARA